MDSTGSLRDVENSLRDFIESVLAKKYGQDWINKSGVSKERINNWKKRKDDEHKKLHGAGKAEDRLIYYSDFYDLKTIIEKKWNDCEDFRSAFNNLKEIRLFLSILDKYRNTDAHRRELLSHQKHLIVGISGEIRNKIIIYRSQMEKEKKDDKYFPKFESIRDNFGNTWTPNSPHTIETNLTLCPGDNLEFIIQAKDPEDKELMYCVQGFTDWHIDNVIQIKITEDHIARIRYFAILMKSSRDYHANGSDYDGEVHFAYKILPK